MKKHNIKRDVMSVAAIMEDYKEPFGTDGKLFFDLNSQRSSGMWNTEWKSDLIHSLIQGYHIPPIHIIAEAPAKIPPMSVIDGKQRITSVREYVLGVFKLSKTTPSVFLPEARRDEEGNLIEGEDVGFYTYDEIEYSIAGKKFSELPKNIQKKILSATFDIILYDGMTEAEIATQMERLNRQKSFNGVQRANVVIGEQMATEVENATKNELFENRVVLTDAKKKAGELKKMILQSLALYTGQTAGQDSCSLRSSDIEKFMKHNKIDKSSIVKIKEILDDLDSMLPRKSYVNENMNGVHIPILVMNYDKYEQMYDDGELTREDYIDFLKWWFEKGINSEDYQQYVDKDAQNRGKVSGRMNVMEDALKNFIEERLEI